MKILTAITLVIIGVVSIPFDLAFSLNHRPTGLSLLALILIIVGLTWLHRLAKDAEGPADVSRLDMLDGISDLTRLTDEQLRAVFSDRMAEAGAAIGTDAFPAAMDRVQEVHREFDRRIDILAARAGRPGKRAA